MGEHVVNLVHHPLTTPVAPDISMNMTMVFDDLF
jgi:hypothetical protein